MAEYSVDGAYIDKRRLLGIIGCLDIILHESLKDKHRHVEVLHLLELLHHLRHIGLCLGKRVGTHVSPELVVSQFSIGVDNLCAAETELLVRYRRQVIVGKAIGKLHLHSCHIHDG